MYTVVIPKDNRGVQGIRGSLPGSGQESGDVGRRRDEGEEPVTTVSSWGGESEVKGEGEEGRIVGKSLGLKT